MTAPGRLRDFAKLAPEVEAVLQRIGDGMWDLIFVSVDGTWAREAFPTEETAEAACAELDVRLHRDWDDPRMFRRMNRRDHWGEPGGQRRAL